MLKLSVRCGEGLYKMKPTHDRTILAGIAGGTSMNIVMLLTFRLLGFGWNGGGILLESSTQSKKLIAVWTEIEPIPLVVNSPVPIIIGIVLFGIIGEKASSHLSLTAKSHGI